MFWKKASSIPLIATGILTLTLRAPLTEKQIQESVRILKDIPYTKQPDLHRAAVEQEVNALIEGDLREGRQKAEVDDLVRIVSMISDGKNSQGASLKSILRNSIESQLSSQARDEFIRSYKQPQTVGGAMRAAASAALGRTPGSSELVGTSGLALPGGGATTRGPQGWPTRRRAERIFPWQPDSAVPIVDPSGIRVRSGSVVFADGVTAESANDLRPATAVAPPMSHLAKLADQKPSQLTPANLAQVPNPFGIRPIEDRIGLKKPSRSGASSSSGRPDGVMPLSPGRVANTAAGRDELSLHSVSSRTRSDGSGDAARVRPSSR